MLISPSRPALALVCLATALTTLTPRLPAQEHDFERAPVFYSETDPQDPLSRLGRDLASGRVRFKAQNDRDYVLELLHELNIPVASQVLVFSKTSKQNERITPRTPRALYFSDDYYVGWVPGGMIEFASVDPELGAVFHLLDQRAKPRPIFERPDDCLSCHAGSRTGDFPGFLVRSVYPNDNGLPLLSEGSFVTTHASPLEERWGGWYVTGRHGDQYHMGNVIAEIDDEDVVTLDRTAGANIQSLDAFFDTRPYLAKTSDILALMVLEHQAEMHNRINRANIATRIALHRQIELQKTFGEKISRRLAGTSLSIVESHVRKVLQHMLFADEMPIVDGAIDSDGEFRDAFLDSRRESADGRSLKDFQLLDRLFKYRCSYMIHSTAFEALPTAFKNRFYRRLYDVLEGNDEEFQHLSESESARIKSILLDTKVDLPAYWRS